jgi:AcrR family transcriptional regulator
MPLFLRKGFRNTTLNDIIDAAAISKGAFYWHFKSKNALLETLIKEFEDTFLDKVIESVTHVSGNFQHRFKYYHKFITEFALHNRDLCVGFVTLSAELTGNGTDIEQQIKRVHDKHRNFLNDLLAQGRHENVLKTDLNTDMAAHVIMAINDGMLLEWYMNQHTIDAKLLAETYRGITLGGILNSA